MKQDAICFNKYPPVTRLLISLLVLGLIFCSLLVQGCIEEKISLGSTVEEQAILLPEFIAQSGIQTYEPKITAVYPHDFEASTQGLVICEGHLYESTGGYGRSTLRQVELSSGKVLNLIDLPKTFYGEGLACDDSRLVQLTWHENVAFIYDRNRFEKISEWTYPMKGWGLTFDGTHFVFSDGSEFLYFLDPETFEVQKRITVTADGQPIRYLNELEFIEGEIFANIFLSDFIARIDPSSGKISSWIDARSLHPISHGPLNGIAYDFQRQKIFLTGKKWANLFEVSLIRDGGS